MLRLSGNVGYKIVQQKDVKKLIFSKVQSQLFARERVLIEQLFGVLFFRKKFAEELDIAETRTKIADRAKSYSLPVHEIRYRKKGWRISPDMRFFNNKKRVHLPVIFLP